MYAFVYASIYAFLYAKNMAALIGKYGTTANYFVLKRVHERTVGVPDRSPFLTDKMNVSDSSLNDQKQSRTVRNGQYAMIIVRIRNGELYATILLDKTKGLKRLQNHVHGTFMFTFQKTKELSVL